MNPAPELAPAQPGRGWRARFCVPGAALVGRDKDEQARLWLLLADGRVLVFRLVRVVPDDAILDALAQALADDDRGDLLEVRLDAAPQACFLVLYGAPASPVFCVDAASPLFGDAVAFHARLDGEALAALARLAGPNTFWASARNYNRLAAHSRRMERLQALQRFPLLVPPILLTRQRWHNLFDPKRYRWRAHDDAVVDAVEQGCDLTGALAAYYGISRGLVRSSFCASAWVAASGRSLAEFLQFLDAMPPNRRPQSGVEVDAYGQHLPALWGMFGAHWLAAASVFREAYGQVWERLAWRFEPLNESLMDAGDYLRLLARWVFATHRRRIDPGKIAALWVGARGLPSLLAASARWHARIAGRGPGNAGGLPETVPAIVGEYLEASGWQARELATWQALADEGEVMRHCVADYWDDCVLLASRVFALESASNEGDERATALFEDTAPGNLPIYRLAQLRGTGNARVSEAMDAFAQRLEKELNAPQRAEGRALARRAGQDAVVSERKPPVERLDDESIAALRSLLALPEASGELAGGLPVDGLRAPVAGYAHALDTAREAHFSAGQPLALVREPDNPFDPLAIRIEWQGHKIGYVPRPDNARYAERLDAGETFTARISEFSPQAPPWLRLWFEIGAE